VITRCKGCNTRARRGSAAALSLAILFAGVTAVAGCQKFKGPEEAQPKPAPTPQAVSGAPDAGAVAGATTADGAPAPAATSSGSGDKPLTFAEEAAQTMTALADGTKACIAEYVSQMDMSRIDDGFLPVNVNQMDKACRQPVELYKQRARKLIGKHPVLDAYLEHAAGFGDAYLRMSFKLKQLGERERWKVVQAVNDYRAKVVEHAAQVAEGAATIGAWPPETVATNEVKPETVDADTYRRRAAELVAWISERLPKVAAAYDRYGYHPADVQEAIHFFSFRFAYASAKRWYDVGVARFEALTCRDGGEKDACAKTKKQLAPVLEAAGKVFTDYETGLEFYRGNYFKKLDQAVPLRDGLHKHVKEFQSAARKARLG